MDLLFGCFDIWQERRRWSSRWWDKRPLQKFRGGGDSIKKCWQGDQLEQMYKPYTDGQLTSYKPVNMRWRTRHGSTEPRKHRRTDNMQFIVWPVHRTFARQLAKTIGRKILFPIPSYIIVPFFKQSGWVTKDKVNVDFTQMVIAYLSQWRLLMLVWQQIASYWSAIHTISMM